MLTMLDLFSGIGGFSLAASWTGDIKTVAFCEIEPYCQKVLKKHWPDVPCYSDIKELNGYDLVREHGAVDIVCGGPPCQPASCAGKRRGEEDDRWLWPEAIRLIREIHPRWCVFENPTGILTLNGGMAFENLLSQMESEGYEVQAVIIPACGVDAPHRRNRVWIVAYSSEFSCDGKRNNGTDSANDGTQRIPASTRRSGCNVADSNRTRQLQSQGIIQELRGRTGNGGEDVANAKCSGFGRIEWRGATQQSENRDKNVSYADSKGLPSRGCDEQAGRSVIGGYSYVPDTCRQRLSIPEQKWQHERSTSQCNWGNIESNVGGVVNGLSSKLDGHWNREPDIPRVATGVRNRADRIKGLGNAVVPQVPYQMLKVIVDIESEVVRQ